ncbi:MAG TPA: hypothetical protein VK021_04735 [Flavobacteriaceae bacterium]|nr:hypothetical protein [Flavobacteriaceae bacterium]
MKNIICLVIALISMTALHAQTEKERIEIAGKINVSLEDEASGINVFNMTSGDYAFTDDYGRFKIEVSEGDELVFSSIQYQQFSVIITKSVIEKKELNVDLVTTTNVLDEVVVKPGLSGDVRVDVKKLKTQIPDLSTESAMDAMYGYDYEFSADRYTSPDNVAIDKGYLKNGINFAYIIKSIFNIKPHQKKVQPEFMDVQIRKLYNDEFFKKYLDIEEESINDFVFFMQDRGLDVSKMRSLNDLELINYIIKESKVYNEEKK